MTDPNRVIVDGRSDPGEITNRLNSTHYIFRAPLIFKNEKGKVIEVVITSAAITSADGYNFEIIGYLNGEKIGITYSLLTKKGRYSHTIDERLF